MKSFKRKLEFHYKLHSELDSHIWKIFERYIKEEGINFNYPQGWENRGSDIYFYGEDGCMGCYDSMSLSIPYKFFLDPETSFAELAIERERKKNEKAERLRIEKEQKDLAEFQRLSAKFGGNQ